MKELLKKALSELAALPYHNTKKTIEKTEHFNGWPSVEELIETAKATGIPLDKLSIGTEECNTLGGSSDIHLSWDVEVDKTEEEIAKAIKERFNKGAWKYVYETLTADGYKRTPCSTSEFRKFDQYNLHDLYHAEEWDILEAYYSLRFKKED